MSPLSPEIYRWLLTIHVIGIVLWAGGLAACSLVLHGASKTDSGNATAVAKALRPVAVFMDIGATLALVFGVILLLGVVPSPLKMPWMHVKLTLVLGLFGLHGFTRVRLKRFRTGKVSSTYPPVLVWVGMGLIAAIIVMVIARPIGG